MEPFSDTTKGRYFSDTFIAKTNCQNIDDNQCDTLMEMDGFLQKGTNPFMYIIDKKISKHFHAFKILHYIYIYYRITYVFIYIFHLPIHVRLFILKNNLAEIIRFLWVGSFLQINESAG